MGGEIGVRSRLNEGSTFWFELPVGQVDAMNQTAQPEAAAPVLHSHRPRNARVLVFEDNLVNQRVVMRLLDKLGYAAEAVSDSQKTVERVTQTQYSLVLMDCQMPIMDGLQATREIRQREVEN